MPSKASVMALSSATGTAVMMMLMLDTLITISQHSPFSTQSNTRTGYKTNTWHNVTVVAAPYPVVVVAVVDIVVVVVVVVVVGAVVYAVPGILSKLGRTMSGPGHWRPIVLRSTEHWGAYNVLGKFQLADQRNVINSTNSKVYLCYCKGMSLP